MKQKWKIKKLKVKKETFIGIGILLFTFTSGFFYFRMAMQPSDLESFAQCLKDKGAVFYGAFWCSHCQNQKKAFGTVADKLPYVECSPPSGEGVEQICVDNEVSAYPTWVFSDGSREVGELSMRQLADKTGCGLGQ